MKLLELIPRFFTPHNSKTYSSYKLKHLLERHMNTYISNEEMIEAMKKLGYKHKKQTDLNVIFYVKELK